MSSPFQIKTVGIIGAGNLAWNLVPAFPDWVSVEQVISRRLSSAKALAKAHGIPISGEKLEDIHPDLDLIFICTGDHQIQEVSNQLAHHKGKKTLVFHSSGSIGLNALDAQGNHKGVFYPLQTFTKNHSTPFAKIPVFLESTDLSREVLHQLGGAMSDKAVELDSHDRSLIHLGAVWACNYSNLMYVMAQKSLKELPDIDFSIYSPLLKESLNNALNFSPEKAQTGPARRRDNVTIDKHLELMKVVQSEDIDLYKALCEKIQKTF